MFKHLTVVVMLAVGILATSAAQAEVILRQSFTFAGGTTITDGTTGFQASRTPTSSLNSAVGVSITAPFDGYISRVEVRINGAIVEPNFSVFYPFIALHSSLDSAGANSMDGDIGNWSTTGLLNPITLAGTTFGGLARYETFLTPEAGMLSLSEGHSAFMVLGFVRMTSTTSDGSILVAETVNSGTFTDFGTGIGGPFGDDGWEYTANLPTSIYDGELAINVFYTAVPSPSSVGVIAISAILASRRRR